MKKGNSSEQRQLEILKTMGIAQSVFDDSDNRSDLLRTFLIAVEIFESEKAAEEWFTTPIAAMKRQTPLQWCENPEGRKWIRDVLGKIESGEFS